ncbi:MAG: hypothetical protein EPO40_08370 [Myxococcaceae bacterium]|nr:MAG: hypothetical protein EPO40_08370 [Myxococcaceae bacterium]
MTGDTASFDHLAHDNVFFDNGAGGDLHPGVGDGQRRPAPPAARTADQPCALDRIRKGVGELTVDVDAAPELCRPKSGAEHVTLRVDLSARRSASSTFGDPDRAHDPRMSH